VLRWQLVQEHSQEWLYYKSFSAPLERLAACLSSSHTGSDDPPLDDEKDTGCKVVLRTTQEHRQECLCHGVKPLLHGRFGGISGRIGVVEARVYNFLQVFATA
jgi:hypothetical protein